MRSSALKGSCSPLSSALIPASYPFILTTSALGKRLIMLENLGKEKDSKFIALLNTRTQVTFYLEAGSKHRGGQTTKECRKESWPWGRSMQKRLPELEPLLEPESSHRRANTDPAVRHQRRKFFPADLLSHLSSTQIASLIPQFPYSSR